MITKPLNLIFAIVIFASFITSCGDDNIYNIKPEYEFYYRWYIIILKECEETGHHCGLPNPYFYTKYDTLMYLYDYDTHTRDKEMIDSIQAKHVFDSLVLECENTRITIDAGCRIVIIGEDNEYDEHAFCSPMIDIKEKPISLEKEKIIIKYKNRNEK